ncbi:sulfite reductase flavoprotein subunit alpha [Chitinophagaceae bacterium LWZ2-11]
MLQEHKLKLFRELVTTSTRDELVWMSGFLAALTKDYDQQSDSAPVKSSNKKITIAYGTETGNAKKLATDFAAKAKKTGVNAKLVSLDQYKVNDLSKEEFFITVISTQGDGEPPAAAQKFYDHIHQNGFKLDKLKHGVLALGDTSYPLFCKAGEDVDQQLEKLGSSRFIDIQKCDTDYESEAFEWFDNVLNLLHDAPVKNADTIGVPKKGSGKKTYTGTVLTNINLNDTGSNKQTHHIEIEVDDVDYAPGDSIGIVPENDLAQVKKIIELTGIPHNKNIIYKEEEYSIVDLLRKKLNIVFLPERVVAKYANIVEQEIPATRMDLLDALKIYPVKNEKQFEEVLTILEPIAPRLYSISSSPNAHSGEIHVTVAKNAFAVNDEPKHGLCSSFLTTINEQENISFYVHKNSQFKLPKEDKDVILIGPGTGIAPFRSFIAERDATGASGKNWLVFGEQHFVSDFLYQTEIQNWYQTGVLNKVSLAFSRDQKEKIYVQHRLLQEAEAVYKWLQNGAYLYVCGTKDPMSADVENALLQIIQTQGNFSQEQAEEYLLQLKDEGRYLKDVY